MSRSYRKNPIIKDHSKHAKKFANRKVRRTEDIANGNLYRRFYPQYDICDWSFRKTVSMAVSDWYDDQAPHLSRYRGKDAPKDFVKDWSIKFYWK